jgi:aminopeptidase N
VAISLDNIDGETDASTVQSLIARTQGAVESFVEQSQRPRVRALLALASRERLSRSQAGGDVQLLWAHTFMDSTREPDEVRWVRGLLDGTTRPDGLVIDYGIRWAAVTALAAIGEADEAVIARELQRDPSDSGQRRAAAARAARPLSPAKKEAWDAVIHDGAPSLAMKRAIAGGFHHVDQEELLRTFVEPFFDSILPIWESHNSDEAIVIIRMMYPRAVIAQEVVDATDAALATDLPGPLRRTLLESQDGIKRALRAQAFDREGTA